MNAQANGADPMERKEMLQKKSGKEMMVLVDDILKRKRKYLTHKIKGRKGIIHTGYEKERSKDSQHEEEED